MKLFAGIYDYCLKLSRHRFATFFLCLNSFIESIFWPVPVDVMLIPMALARPERALRFAFYATVASVLGAVVGYGLGYWIYDPYIHDMVKYFGGTANFDKAMMLLNTYGILFIVIGSFTPLPYKVVAICCGVIAAQRGIGILSFEQLGIISFIVVSFLGREARFFLISGLIKLGGASMEQKIRRYIDVIGWLCLIIVVLAGIYYWLFSA